MVVLSKTVYRKYTQNNPAQFGAQIDSTFRPDRSTPAASLSLSYNTLYSTGLRVYKFPIHQRLMIGARLPRRRAKLASIATPRLPVLANVNCVDF